jgi:Terminase large subunit, T4likevirus-type, N-terminal
MAMTASALKLALDPVRFAESVGFGPDMWQASALRSTAPRLLLNCCRQSGKSTIVAFMAMHRAIYRPDSLILLVSPTQRQSAELLRKCIDIYQALGRPVSAQAETLLRVDLLNGSRVLSLPGRDDAAIRGYSSVALLIIDEAARVSDGVHRAMRPVLAVSGGRVVALSTPWGRRGWYFNEWTEGGTDWQRVKITAAECPRISPAFLEAERRSLGPLFFASEYLCQFTQTVDAAFRWEDIQAAFDPTVMPLFLESAA